MNASILDTPAKIQNTADKTDGVWREFQNPKTEVPAAHTIHAQVVLTQSGREQRQFVVKTGSGHSLLIDDAAGGSGPKPIELVAAALAGCTAFDVITILRNKKHQNVTHYEVHVTAEQAPRPPQVFVAVKIRHIVTGYDVDPVAVSEAIKISEEKYCSVEAMLKQTATISTTFEVLQEHQ
jgi:putative redox protein